MACKQKKKKNSLRETRRRVVKKNGIPSKSIITHTDVIIVCVCVCVYLQIGPPDCYVYYVHTYYVLLPMYMYYI